MASFAGLKAEFPLEHHTHGRLLLTYSDEKS
jgi:hypothetical protein